MHTVAVFIESIALNPFGSPEAWQALKSFGFYGSFLVLFQLLQVRMKTLYPLPSLPSFVRLNLWIFVLMSLLALGVTTSQEFIYFEF
jgi:hypothetical protein